MPETKNKTNRDVVYVYVSLASLAGLIWYGLVEFLYFGLQGPHFRKIFAKANGVPSKEFSYRAPWAPIVAYTLLVAAYTVLAVLPALGIFDKEHQHNNTYITPRSVDAFLGSLWRAIVLSLAVYGTYDLATHATIFPFGLKSALIDMAYGVIILPALVVAPVSAMIAAALSA